MLRLQDIPGMLCNKLLIDVINFKNNRLLILSQISRLVLLHEHQCSVGLVTHCLQAARGHTHTLRVHEENPSQHHLHLRRERDAVLGGRCMST